MGISIDNSALAEMSLRVDDIIDGIYEKLPSEIRERIEQRRLVIQPKPEAITEEDGMWIKEHIDELFKKGGEEDERAA